VDGYTCLSLLKSLSISGCNDYNPGRQNYYQYLMSVFDYKIIPVEIVVDMGSGPITLNSMKCTADLQAYCHQ